jgi:surfactin synthase thioesterase subunit
MLKPQLFLIHFAGGSSYSFEFLLPELQAFDTIPLELPGRGRRMNEPLLKSFDLAAWDIFQQLKRMRNSSRYFLIYGHSMGAYLALRVANILEGEGDAPSYVIVSGNAGPMIREERYSYSLCTAEFIDVLRDLGGMPEELLGNEDLFRVFEPVLRADFEISEKCELLEEPAVSAPIYAVMGRQEKKIDKIGNWSNFTRTGFDCTTLEGGHFFIYDHSPLIGKIINDCYRRTIATTNAWR